MNSSNTQKEEKERIGARVELAKQAYLPNTLSVFVGFSYLYNLMFLKILAAFVQVHTYI